MGTFVRPYFIDGESYELYLAVEDGIASYQLVDILGAIIVDDLDEEPDDDTARALVRLSYGYGSDAV